MKKIILLCVLSGMISLSHAQLFTEVTTATFPGIYIGNCAWGDYDNDNQLDIFLTGYATGSVRTSKIFKNNSDGTFTDIAAPLIQVGNSSGEWYDYNNDNNLDVVVGGNYNPGGIPLTRLYQNAGSNVFNEITTILSDMYQPGFAFGDYDMDGDYDLVQEGLINSSDGICKLYNNGGSGVFTEAFTFDNLSDGALAFGDYDNDGDKDLLYAGRIASFDYITRLYINNGNGTFTNSGQTFTGLRGSSAAFGDYDSDGDLDILISGSDNTDVLFTIIYKNNNGSFVNINAPLTPIRMGDAVWGDYDNDGDLDVLLIGQTNSGGSTMKSTIFQNNGGDVFVEVTGLPFPGLRRSSCAFGDYNNDGKLDVLLNGRNESGTYQTRLYLNNATTVNTPPSVPSGLSSLIAGSDVTLSWNASSDGQTPAAGLTYNVRVGTTPGGVDIVSPNANLGTGYRKLPQIGNANMNTFLKLKNLPDGTYYFSVQAVDNAFAGSGFAAEATFTIGGPALKTLNLNLLLESLFNGINLNKAQDEMGDHFPGTVADKIAVALADATSPYGITYSDNSVDINTDGSSSLTIPGSYAANYYIVIKHRNSIETWSAAPVDFSGITISYSFKDAAGKAYGNNQQYVAAGLFAIYAADPNQDGVVDSNDLGDIDNDSNTFTQGYVVTDVNGDGIVDSNDMGLTDNNSNSFVGKIVP